MFIVGYPRGVNLGQLRGPALAAGFQVGRDPEGLLSTLPTVATCLLGVFVSLLLRSPALNPHRKTAWLPGACAGVVALGWLWHLEFRVIKAIWTSSYVLVTGGDSAVCWRRFIK